MSIRKLPRIDAPARPKNLQWDAPSDVMARWAQGGAPETKSDPTVITMFDVIGEDWWTGGGVTAAAVAKALADAGDVDITVQINSPGGDMFEGIAIYNLLALHKGKVTVEVMGWAASAASIIAMAGDEIVMMLGSFMMVHNAWGLTIGNRHDFEAAAKLFATFDSAIADIYEARTEMKRADITALMDAETFMSPAEAIDNGFADRKGGEVAMTRASLAGPSRELMAQRHAEAVLARAGFSRSDRQSLFAQGVAQRDASHDTAARDAGDLQLALDALLKTIRN